MLTNTSVPIVLNIAQNRIRFYPSDLDIASDVQVIGVSFYEKNGRYWFCLESSVSINSVPFVSVRNCVSSFKDTVKTLGFELRHPDVLAKFVLDWERSLGVKKEVSLCLVCS